MKPWDSGVREEIQNLPEEGDGSGQVEETEESQ